MDAEGAKEGRMVRKGALQLTFGDVPGRGDVDQERPIRSASDRECARAPPGCMHVRASMFEGWVEGGGGRHATQLTKL